jgi:epoxyqueuosine reductase
MLLNKRFGSYLFLGALLLDLDLQPDQPFESDHCGTCTACLDACPTQAFAGPGQLDARRCISYLTIELRGPIPTELREPMGDWIFGCDICQEVCPWNRKAPPSKEPAFQPLEGLATPDLVELLGLSPEAFRQRFRGTTIPRTKRSGLLRNVAIALGNSGDLRAVPALIKALQDAEPPVRGAAAWALGRLATEEARAALQARHEVETDAMVLEELQSAQGSGTPLACGSRLNAGAALTR